MNAGVGSGYPLPNDEIGVKEGNFPPSGVEIGMNVGIGGITTTPENEHGCSFCDLFLPPRNDLLAQTSALLLFFATTPSSGDEIDMNAGGGWQYKEGECV